MTQPMPAPGGRLLRYLTFDTRRNVMGVCLAACLLTALAALGFGQDANWDLRNYHLYSGWAVLHGRLSIDFAPAQLQSYFVPWLDAGYYLLAVQGSPRLASGLLGALHGLAFATVAAVAWLALERDPRRAWLAPLLGLAGCLCSVVFCTGLGNSMGDDTTAPLVIGALALTLRAARTSADRHWLLAGLLLGLALAFKLTNAPYALGLGVAALVSGGGWKRRLRGAALMTLAALVVFTLIAGPWFWRVYQQFGNPLFPQLNQWFHSPLALPASNNDATMLPKNVWQILAWPVLISVKPDYMGGIRMYQPAWGALYLLAALLIIGTVLRRVRPERAQAPGSAPASLDTGKMLAAFVAVSFAGWMAAFSIYRYLVALELVAPLALWLLTRRTFAQMFASATAEKWAAALVAICVAAGCAATYAVLKRNSWSHVRWARQGFNVQAPPMPQPQTATVLLTGGDPQAWRIPFLPEQAAYARISGFFPVTSGYDDHIRGIAAQRGGTVYALFSGAQENAPCQCMLPPPYSEDTAYQNRILLDAYEAQLGRHGWQLQRETCAVHASHIGKRNYPFHWCKVRAYP